MSKLNAFLDLDGPILDVSRRHFLVYSDIVKSFGATPIEFADFWSAKRHKVPDVKILSRSGVADFAAEYTVRKLQLIEADEYLELDQLQEGALKTLALIKEHYFLVLVTLRRSRPSLERQLRRLGVDRYLDQMLTSGDEEAIEGGQGWRVKCQLVRSAGLSTGSSDFFVGDTETDILAGKSLGTRTVAVLNGIRDEHFLLDLNPTFAVAGIDKIELSTLLEA